MRNRLALAVTATALLVATSCGDSHTSQPLPTMPQASDASQGKSPANPPAAPGTLVPGTCTTNSAIEGEINDVVPPGNARGSVHGDFGKLGAAINKNDYAGAQALAFSINKFLIQLFKTHGLSGTPAQAAKLMNDLFCYSGLSITITDPGNANIIFPTDGSQVVVSSGGTAGSSLPSGAITEPTVLQFVPIPDTFGGNGHGPLHTKLDQYGGFVVIATSSASGAPLKKPVIVAVCPPAGMDGTVRGRLRLGHDATAGFEITPPADGSFLTCPTTIGAAPSKVPAWLRSLASAVLPKAAYARVPFFAAGGVGGTASEFSPFDAIDPDVSFSGGVGGTAGEFQVGPRNPPRLSPTESTKPDSAASFRFTPGSPSNTVVAGTCTDTATVWGGLLEQQCSPAVSLHTNLGTKLTGVPVVWTIGLGGGTVAPVVTAPFTCGAFGSTAGTTTDANGEAHICWTLGQTPGHLNNTVIATPTAGGDVPAGAIFVPATGTFTASALKRTPTATATGANAAFDAAPHGGSGTCSDGLVPVLSYAAGATPPAGPPSAAGTYTLTVTCSDGNVKYNTATATAAIVITFGFSDGFEVASGWTTTGLWHRSTLRTGLSPIVNALFPSYVDAPAGDVSNGALPAPFAGSWVFWYGSESGGNYIDTQAAGDALHSGGTSTAAHSGTLTSPSITLPNIAGASLVLRFNTWWEIESVNPSKFDVMEVSVYDVAANTTTPLGVLNPASDPATTQPSTPFTSGGYNAPPVWTEVVQDLSAFRGRTIKLVYSFDTRDVLYDGFRGLLIDNVRVATEAVAPSSVAPGGTARTSRPVGVTSLHPVPPTGTRPPRNP